MDESDIVQNALSKSAEDTIEIEEVTDEVERQPSSALEENIMNKGKNAYYYAHAGNLGKGADKKNLGGAPRLLTRTESKKDDSVKSRRKNNITDYSWADADKKVSIYITSLENLGSIDPDNIKLETSKSGMKLCLLDLEGEDYILEIPNLNGEIRKGKTKLIKEKNKLIVSLFKSEEFSWYDLRKG